MEVIRDRVIIYSLSHEIEDYLIKSLQNHGYKETEVKEIIESIDEYYQLKQGNMLRILELDEK